jgi:hypothetical protein
MSKDLTASVSNTSSIIRVAIDTSHAASTANAQVEADSTSLTIGDSIDISLGYVGTSGKVFSGYVKQIVRTTPDNTYTIIAHDELIRAVDFFIASSNPEAPFSRSNISAEDLIEDLLGLAGLTSYTSGTTNYTYAVESPVEINLASVYDSCKTLADIVAWHIWADNNGLVHFEDRKPYVMGGDSPYKTLTDATILSATYGESEKDLRNRVVVYGGGSIYANAQQSSPYLPSGFYKAVVLSSPAVDTQTMAQQAADYNLVLFNRLKYNMKMEVEGDYTLLPHKVVTVTETILGVDSDWYIYAANHFWDRDGYKVSLELRK